MSWKYTATSSREGYSHLVPWLLKSNFIKIKDHGHSKITMTSCTLKYIFGFFKVKVPTVSFLKIFIGGTLNLDDNLSSNPNQLNKVKWESRMKIKQKHSINHLSHFNLKFKHFHPIERYLLIITNDSLESYALILQLHARAH